MAVDDTVMKVLLTEVAKFESLRELASALRSTVSEVPSGEFVVELAVSMIPPPPPDEP